MAGPISDDLQQLQNGMNKLIEQLGITNWFPANLGGDVKIPPADVKETDDAVIVTLDLPGINKEDIDISVLDNELRVVAERKEEREESDKGYHKRERAYNRFERLIPLPVAVRAEEASAKMDNGVLKVTLPKEIVTTKKRINVS
ncbi:MAG: Hsp20/alpha crystallin family protein [Methanotrichaceae archaeon]